MSKNNVTNMIQITLRRRTNNSSPESSVQRPERPTRNYPNSSSPHSFIIRTSGPSGPSGQRDVYRDELPRPNAPVHDEIYSNRSISPLFVGLNNHQNGFLYMYRPTPPLGNSSDAGTTASNPIASPRLEFLNQPGTSGLTTPQDSPQDLSQLSAIFPTNNFSSFTNCSRRNPTPRSRRGSCSPYVKPRTSQDVDPETIFSNLAGYARREKELLKAVLSALECPVCRDYATPPIKLCHEGHMLCSNCRSRLNVCPECRGPFLNTRARGLENIALAVDYPCSNPGCNTEVPLTMRLHHSVTCSNRRFPCLFRPENECSWEGLKCDIVEHGLSMHGNCVTNNSTWNFNLELLSDDRRCVIMSCFENLFQVLFFVDVAARFVFGTIIKLGQSEATREFLATISCESPGIEEPKVKMTFCHIPLAETSLTQNKFSLINSAPFRFPFDTLRELMDDNMLTFTVSISRTTEENMSVMNSQIENNTPPLREQQQLLESWRDRVSPSR